MASSGDDEPKLYCDKCHAPVVRINRGDKKRTVGSEAEGVITADYRHVKAANYCNRYNMTEEQVTEEP